jgi:hypothetical protein
MSTRGNIRATNRGAQALAGAARIRDGLLLLISP